MRGQLIRHKVEPVHRCRPPGWWSRYVNDIGLRDRWICPDCGRVWELRYEEIVGEFDAPKKVWVWMRDDTSVVRQGEVTDG